MYISVIPLKHTLSTDGLLYSVSDTWRDSIIMGGLVEVPIGRHIDLGVISEVFWDEGENHIRDITYEVRPIISVITQTQILSEGQIAIIFAIARRYYIPIHKIASLFLPAPLLSRLDKKNYLLPDISIPTANTSPRHQIHHFQDRIFQKKDLEKYEQPGTVFCFPDDLFLFSFASGSRDGTLILSNESTPTKKSQSWIDIYGRKDGIIIGTRRILYYNLKAYKHLVYIEESFGSEHFQFPSRIRTLDILRALADATDIDITIITSSPSLGLFADFRDFILIPLKI